MISFTDLTYNNVVDFSLLSNIGELDGQNYESTSFRGKKYSVLLYHIPEYFVYTNLLLYDLFYSTTICSVQNGLIPIHYSVKTDLDLFRSFF